MERQHGVEFEVCPVTGHNQHGHVDCVIRSLQASFNDSGLLTKRYTATTLQRLAKLIENNYNNLPLGYHYHKTAGKNTILKMICTNHLRMGRLKKRALDGPMRLLKNMRSNLRLFGRILMPGSRYGEMPMSRS